MKCLVTYASKYGSTKKYAQWIAEELACDVPVYELACTPDQNAVEMLRQELSGGVSR